MSINIGAAQDHGQHQGHHEATSAAIKSPSTLSWSLGLSTAALALAIATTPAAAQDVGQATATQAAENKPAPAVISSPDTTAQATDDKSAQGDVVVTGTLFRRTNTETPSPVTVLTSDNLEARGVNTLEDAVQRLSANGSGSLPTGFTPTGFAKGASAPSLRGLTTSSTLVLFDGLRAAYYPIADDGTRNFVDINAIPDAIVDRVEVLKDGASSTYGADAVAGVINIITKKQIQGVHLNASTGISQYGDGAEQRFTATAGYGDLEEQGFNVYVSGEYQKDGTIMARDRGYPYSTSDLSRLCGVANGGNAAFPAGSTVCRLNAVANGIQFNNVFLGVAASTVPVVRPSDALGNAIAGSRYQLLNPALGCGALNTTTLTGAQLTNTGGNSGATAPTGPFCQLDLRQRYFTIQPSQEREGASARITKRLGDSLQAYAEFNYYRTNVSYGTTPASVNVATAAGGTQYTTPIVLPVYVCPRGTTVACTAANGTLNPNNPFAALGQSARILYRFADIDQGQSIVPETYRGAAGVTGTLFGDYKVSLDATYMRQNASQTFRGTPYINNVLQAVADGSYNFVNPALNSQAVRDFVAPTLVNRLHSTLFEVQGNVSKAVFELPGGPLQVGVGAAYRYEDIFEPSANPVNANPLLGYSGLNRVGTSGSRRVYSAFGEIGAPILRQVELNASGRFDHYSTGPSNFSPKFGIKITPVRQIAFRGTFSRGFRIPSFAENFTAPLTGGSTGLVTAATPGGPAYLAAHNNDGYATGPYLFGLTSTGNPNLKPEKSRNFTLGTIIEPIRGVSLSVDYYDIRKTGVIDKPDTSQIQGLYYANNGVVNVPGISVTPAAADPSFPNALPQLGAILYSFVNGDTFVSRGIDFDFEVRRQITPSIKFTSSLDATLVLALRESLTSGTTLRFEGTLGPCETTSCSGTPRWKGSWQNTVEVGRATVSATAYYTSGYTEDAADDGGIYENCLASLGADVQVYRDGTTPVLCRTKHFIDVDLTGSLKVSDRFTIYGNVLNVFGVKPPYDPGTYGAGSIAGNVAGNYNPAWAQQGIVGRYFRVGAKVNF